MSKTVTFTADVYPYCVGDVIVLNDDELKAVDKIAKARKVKVYEDHAEPVVDSSEEADRQAAELAAKKADAAAHNSASGHTVAGTAAGTKVKTAAAE